jgi:hypothetical protein
MNNLDFTNVPFFEPSGLTKRAADRPVRAIFRVLLLQTAFLLQNVALAGRRLTQAVGPLY